MSLARNATPAGTTRPTSNDVEDGEIIEPTTAANNNNNTPIAVSSTSSPDFKQCSNPTPLWTHHGPPPLCSALHRLLYPHTAFHITVSAFTLLHNHRYMLKQPAVTPDELDSAKSLVLDLLGWGVEPEYLVDCGVSPAVIHRIFTDLRLRLPRNLAFPA